MQEVLEVRAARQDTRADKQADAQTYWTERKAALGITETLDAPAQLAAVCLARTQVRDHAPVRTVAEAQAGVEVDDRALGDLAGETYRATWHEAQAVWEEARAEQMLRDMGWEAVEAARGDGREALVASAQEQQALVHAGAWQSVEHELHAQARQLDALSANEGRAGGVRIRLWDREQGYGLTS